MSKLEVFQPLVFVSEVNSTALGQSKMLYFSFVLLSQNMIHLGCFFIGGGDGLEIIMVGIIPCYTSSRTPRVHRTFSCIQLKFLEAFYSFLQCFDSISESSLIITSGDRHEISRGRIYDGF